MSDTTTGPAHTATCRECGYSYAIEPARRWLAFPVTFICDRCRSALAAYGVIGIQRYRPQAGRDERSRLTIYRNGADLTVIVYEPGNDTSHALTTLDPAAAAELSVILAVAVRDGQRWTAAHRRAQVTAAGLAEIGSTDG